jgi:urate oxidase
MARLIWNGYGKAAVRLVKVDRGPAQHHLHDLTVDTQLQGDFEAAHLSGDNAVVLPTDTMKNTVYAFAREGPVDPPESFAERLGRHFLTACPAARRAVVSVFVHGWSRAGAHSREHPHAFVRGTAERRIARVTVDAVGAAVEAGVDGVGLLKTADSAFTGFLREGHTTLVETRDRIFATELEAEWRYKSTSPSWNEAWAAVRAALVGTFADHRSESVQQTLYAMGTAALDACGEVTEIRLLLPNRHHLLVDLTPFDLDNPNQVFVATQEPYGRIEAVIAR